MLKKWTHILMGIALLMAILPCAHAFETNNSHAHHHASSEDGINAPITCTCHTNHHAPCCEEIDIPQELVPSTTLINAPATSVIFFVFSETKPVLCPPSPAIAGMLSFLQTIQLLI